MKNAIRRFAAAAITAAAFSAVASDPGRGIEANPAFGGALAVSSGTVPTVFSISFFEPAFAAGHGAVDDGGAAGSFRVRTGAGGRESDIRGTAAFSEAEGGAIRAEWTATPGRDASTEEFYVGAPLRFSVLGGGAAALDGGEREIPIPDASSPAGRPVHLFRGEARSVAFRDASGEVRLAVRFDRPVRILLQDSRKWERDTLDVRFFFAEKATLRGGGTLALAAEISTPAAGPLVLGEKRVWKVCDGPDWVEVPDDEAWIESGSALDFSGVVPHHAPAGKFGRVVAAGDRFEFEGLPGVPQRFYGFNVCNDANFPRDLPAARRFAANMARMGYNAIRLHHHDKGLVGFNPDAFRPSAAGCGDDASSSRDGEGAVATPPGLDPDRLRRFDALVAACIENGIYLTTDLHVSRPVPWRKVGIDRDGCMSQDEFKLLCPFWEPAYSNLCAFAKEFLRHENPYTGRCLAEEPALCALALVNEGNLGNWGAAALRALPGVQEAWSKWQKRQMSTTVHKLQMSTNANENAKDGELEFGFGFVDNGGQLEFVDNSAKGLPDDLYSQPVATFLADADARLFRRLSAFVRDECGCRAPLSNDSSWYEPAQYALQRRDFDYVDNHFYIAHPSFLDEPWKRPSRTAGGNPFASGDLGVPGVVHRRLAGKPFTISEYNWCAPSPHRAAGGLATGALAARQGWSGLYRFAWSHGADGLERPGTGTLGYFKVTGDPVTLAAERAAMCLFLRGDMDEAEETAFATLSEERLRDPAFGAPKLDSLGKPAAAWEKKVGVAFGGEAPEGRRTPVRREEGRRSGDRLPGGGALGERALPERDGCGDDAPVVAGQSERRSGDRLPGGIEVDPAEGTLSIDTPRTSGGYAERGALDCGALAFRILSTNVHKLQMSTNANENAKDGELEFGFGFVDNGGQLEFVDNSFAPAAVWASSLDGAPLGESSRILLVHLPDVQNSGATFADPQRTTLLDWGRAPRLMRRAAARVSLDLSSSPLREGFEVWRLSASGRRLGTVPAAFDPATGRLEAVLRTDADPAAATWLYEIARAAAAAAAATTGSDFPATASAKATAKPTAEAGTLPADVNAPGTTIAARRE